jgi:hypothetical protein
MKSIKLKLLLLLLTFGFIGCGDSDSKTSTESYDFYDFIISKNNINTNDDFTTIKKQYRKLIHLYHPDKHLDNKVLYTQITVNLNKAYSYFKK